jgi:hypothetical protein
MMITQIFAEHNKSKSFESEFTVQALCEFHLQGRVVAAYLLINRQEYKLLFFFQTQGEHPFVGQSQYQLKLKRWNEGIKGVQVGETIRIYQRSRSDALSRLKELDLLAERLDNPYLTYLNYCEQRSVQERTLIGYRQLLETFIVCSYTYRPDDRLAGEGKLDFLDRAITQVGAFYKDFKGGRRSGRQLLEQILYQAFRNGFLQYEEHLRNRMGLIIEPFNGDELHELAWGEINSGVPKDPCPYILKMSEGEQAGEVHLEQIINDQVGIVSSLIRGVKGHSTTPQGDMAWVYLPGRGQFCAALVLEQPFEAFADKERFYQFYWDILCSTRDCEICSEYEIGDLMWSKINLQRMARNANSRIESAKRFHTINVDAEETMRQVKEAQSKLLDGDRPLSVGTVIFLYRNTPEEIDQGCRHLLTYFPDGKLIRDSDITYELWVNRFIFSGRPLLSRQRKHVYFSDEAPLPLVAPEPFDSKGLELIEKSSGQPIYIDFFTQHRGIIICAQSRAGKSALAAEVTLTSLYHLQPTIILDYGLATEGGGTTYTSLVDFLGDGAIAVDVALTPINFIELPDFREYSLVERVEATVPFINFIYNALKHLFLGKQQDSFQAKRVTSFLKFLLSEFFQSHDTQVRYDAAYAGGIGSEAWQEIPTLKDIFALALKIDLEPLGSIAIMEEARQEVVGLLGSFLSSPLGRSFSQPSRLKFEEARYIVFSLRGAADEAEATICGLASQIVAFKLMRAHKRLTLLIDEGSLLFKDEGLVKQTSELVVNGGKSGCMVGLLTQDIDAIALSIAGQQLMVNLKVKMIGVTEESALKNLSLYLNKPEEAFQPNTEKRFLPDPIRSCSHWLLLVESRTTQVSHYPSLELLSLIASNPSEREPRELFFAEVGDRIAALPIFAELYKQSKRSKIPLMNLVKEHLQQLEVAA